MADDALAVALAAAALAIDLMHSTPRGEVRRKAHAADPVTDIDLETERAVREHLLSAFPDHVVVGEEFGGTTQGGPTWYCDPVDGTTNLAAGLPWTSFSLSLVVDGAPVVGVVADPWRREILYAAAGGGASRRTEGGSDHPIRVTPAQGLSGEVVLTEWAAHQPWRGMLPLLEALSEEMCTTRIMGSGTLSVSCVGAGRAAGAVIGEFHPEDHLAGLLIGIEAGACVLDSAGEPSMWPEPGPFVIAAPAVAEQLCRLATGA
ncbi:MAG: inositol monophosphatase [Actinomycetota bacterium]|nr:inositol monophosphatase [Actinomycetota bacterium]